MKRPLLIATGWLWMLGCSSSAESASTAPSGAAPPGAPSVTAAEGASAPAKPAFFSDTWPYGDPSSFRQRRELIESGVLFDGMPPELARSVLGPPTSTQNGRVEWYHNPDHRWHVAAGFRARVGVDGKYFEWATDNW